MSTTPNLALPFIEAGQAQKHVTHNEALRLLDTLVQLAVQSRDLAAPPAAPAEGARWIVKAAAADAWAGHDNEIAAWQDGAWAFAAPAPGWLAYAIGEAALVAWDGSAWSAVSTAAGGAARERLTANRTYYVRTDGSDANNGLAGSAGGAFLTLQKAADVIYGSLDLGGHDVLVQAGAGTYGAGVNADFPQVGKGKITFSGDTATPPNVTVSVSGDCFRNSSGARFYVQGFKLVSSGGHGLYTVGGEIHVSGNMEYGACAQGHIEARQGLIDCIGADYTISGAAPAHVLAQQMGRAVIFGCTITLTGTPAFGGGFVYCSDLSYGNFGSLTFSGLATGARYALHNNSICATGGGGANYFPGDAAGSADTGALYN